MGEAEGRSPSEHDRGRDARPVRALIVVARDRPDIWEHFTRLFARDAWPVIAIALN